MTSICPSEPFTLANGKCTKNLDEMVSNCGQVHHHHILVGGFKVSNQLKSSCPNLPRRIETKKSDVNTTKECDFSSKVM